MLTRPKTPIGCLSVAFVVVLLLFSPFLVETLWNDYKLYEFSSQLDVVDDLVGDRSQKLGALSERYKGPGSGEYCYFTAYRQYRVSRASKKHQEIRAKLDELRFKPAGERADGADAKFFYVLESWILAVMIDDGPETTVFDLRC